MDNQVWQAAERLMREYGKDAESQCDSRISYNEMQGYAAKASHWRQVKYAIERMRRGEKPPT